MTTRTITSYGDLNDIYVAGLTRGPGSGWSWNGAALVHNLMRITLTTEAAARVDAALAAARPVSSERMTGYQVSQLPESERDGWTFAEEIDSIGYYVRSTPAVKATAEFDTAEVVSVAQS